MPYRIKTNCKRKVVKSQLSKAYGLNKKVENT